MAGRKELRIRVVKWRPGAESATVTAFLKREAFHPRAEEIARDVLERIRNEGNRAVVHFAREFDGVALQPRQFRVSRAEIDRAARAVDPAFRRAVREARKRIVAFARKGMRKDWRMATPRGGRLGEQFVPYDRVGAYVPGGSAPLVSTALMTVSIARAAGVPEIAACTPCGPDRRVNPFVLHALDSAGATEIYRLGGIQAIGLMAYGTSTVAKVQKIVGPGGTYVTAAKRQVYGHVALDLVAGPSEIAVLADEHADPRRAAADLLSQAEHGTGWEKTLLVTPSAALARAVRRELVRQVGDLSRRAAASEVLRKGTLLVIVPSLDDGVELCNRFAPEHLEIMTRNPRRWTARVRCAGAIFVGEWTPESAGDFVAGPSHVLPTGGAAAMFSGLTVDDFRRRSSVIEFTRGDLLDALPVIETFGAVEGLDAHARSARLRFE